MPPEMRFSSTTSPRDARARRRERARTGSHRRRAALRTRGTPTRRPAPIETRAGRARSRGARRPDERQTGRGRPPYGAWSSGSSATNRRRQVRPIRAARAPARRSRGDALRTPSTPAVASTDSRAAWPSPAARRGSARTRLTATASASGFPGGTSRMFSPSRSPSGSQSPRVRLRTTGRAHAEAWRVTLWPDGCGTSFTGTATAAESRNASRTSSSLSNRRCQSAGSQRTFSGSDAGRGWRVRIRISASMAGAARRSVSQSRCPSFPIASTVDRAVPPGDQNAVSTPNRLTWTRPESRGSSATRPGASPGP